MNTSECIPALRRANPRDRAGFVQAVESAEEQVRAAIATAGAPGAVPRQPDSRRRLARRAAAAVAVAVAAGAALLSVGLIGGGTGVEGATAAVERAATITAASAERSGTAELVMTHNGEPWAQKTVRWNGADVSISDDGSTRDGRKRELRVVDGMMYGPDGDGRWLVLGSPASIDPDSGTTPDEHLAAIREDIGGVTLRRITRGVKELATAPLADGSTVYRGTVAAGLIARETGFKEGQHIRVLPFGYVAHDEAADPASPLDVAVTVGADGLVRSIAVSWGPGASAWTYTVTYSDLGTTPAIAAPANARPLRDRWPAAPAPRGPDSGG
jgi:hypothetical protein